MGTRGLFHDVSQWLGEVRVILNHTQSFGRAQLDTWTPDVHSRAHVLALTMSVDCGLCKYNFDINMRTKQNVL